MLKGSREAVLHRLQPISIHGQLSYDVHYTFADEPDSQARVARVGGEAIGMGCRPATASASTFSSASSLPCTGSRRADV